MNQENKDINSPSNVVVRFYYDQKVSQLKNDDIGFSDIYDRYFSNDPVYDKVFTPRMLREAKK
jgi:hypothetical protein